MQRIREARLVNGTTTPYVELDRAAWSRLAASTPLPLTAEDVERLRGLGDEIDLNEVREVYLPLTRLLRLFVHGRAPARAAGATRPGRSAASCATARGRRSSSASPAGSRWGSRTVARLLRELLARWPDRPRV